MRIRWILATAVVLVLGSSTARPEGPDAAQPPGESADPPPSVRVLLLETRPGPGTGADEAARVGALLVDALSALDHIEISDPKGLDRDEVPTQVSEDLARASNFARKGRENLLNLSLEEAADAYQTARVLMRKHLHWLDDPEPLIVVLMGLAEALAAGGDPGSAGGAYHEVLVLSPGYEPDPGQVPSKFRSLFDDVRARASQELAGSLSVITRPEGASVEVDGLSAGTAPVLKEGVPPGLHAVRLRKEGFRTVRRTVEVLEGQITPVEARLTPRLVHDLVRRVRRALSGRDSDPGPVALARDLASIAKVRAVLLSQVTRVGEGSVMTLALVLPIDQPPHILGARIEEEQGKEVAKTLAWQVSDRLEAGNVPRSPPADLGLSFDGLLLGEPRPEEPRTTVVRVLQPGEPVGTSSAHPAVPPPDRPPEEPGEEVPIWGKWWFWTGAGVLVLAAVGTTLALTLERETETVFDPDLVRIRIDRVTP